MLLRFQWFMGGPTINCGKTSKFQQISDGVDNDTVLSENEVEDFVPMVLWIWLKERQSVEKPYRGDFCLGSDLAIRWKFGGVVQDSLTSDDVLDYVTLH